MKTKLITLILSFISMIAVANTTSIQSSKSYPPDKKPLETKPQNEETQRDPSMGGISANPAASEVTLGTGELGHLLGLNKNSGFRLGGLWNSNGNYLFNGGVYGSRWSGNSLEIVGLSADTQQLQWWQGGKFNVQFLQFNGDNTNGRAGIVQGYNGLPAGAPFGRSELYQLWYRQRFGDKFLIYIGKLVPIYDYNNVLQPVNAMNPTSNIPAVSGLLYTPIFVNPTMLGIMPGYYNSAYGATSTFSPNKYFYVNLGAYDGNLARGVQTGLNGPHFNGYYLYLGETGVDWNLFNLHPGRFAIGTWQQTGRLTTGNIQENGAKGIYAFGSQNVWKHNPGIDNSGVSIFYDLGLNGSKTLPINKYASLGVTAFGLTRPKDSFGAGLAWSWLNQNKFDRSSELMLQTYYQAHLFCSTYLTPAISFIPTPGASKNLPPTWAATVQLTMLF